MNSKLRCGAVVAAGTLAMLALQASAQQPATQQQPAPRVQERRIQPAQPGQVLPGQPLPGQPRAAQQAQPAAPGQMQQGLRGTHIMAHWLLVDNQGEIELAKFAQENAQNEEVKEFAKMMIQDHTDFLGSLQHLAGALDDQPAGQPGQPGQPPLPPDRAGQRPDQGQAQATEREQGQAQATNRDRFEGQQDRAPGQAQPGQGQTEQAGQNQRFSQTQQERAQSAQPGQFREGQPAQGQRGAPGQPAAMGFDIVRIKHELGQQCLASTKKMLEEKEGAEFDKAYMGQQLFSHMQMLDTLKVFKRHAQGDFADLIQNGIATTEDHLMHAEKICKQLDGAAASTARRPGTQRE